MPVTQIPSRDPLSRDAVTPAEGPEQRELFEAQHWETAYRGFNPDEVPHLLIHERSAALADLYAKPHDRIPVNSGNPLNTADAGTLCQHGNHGHFLFGFEDVCHIKSFFYR